MRNHNGKAPIIIMLVLLVLASGVLGTFMFAKKASSGHVKPTIEQAPTEAIPMDEFVVNLADMREARYLKVEMVLDIRGSGAKEEVSHCKAKIRDRVIQILSSKHYKELLEQDGKETLKVELRDALNKALEDSKVVDVYFTSFAMQ